MENNAKFANNDMRFVHFCYAWKGNIYLYPFNIMHIYSDLVMDRDWLCMVLIGYDSEFSVHAEIWLIQLRCVCKWASRY